MKITEALKMIESLFPMTKEQLEEMRKKEPYKRYEFQTDKKSIMVLTNKSDDTPVAIALFSSKGLFDENGDYTTRMDVNISDISTKGEIKVRWNHDLEISFTCTSEALKAIEANMQNVKESNQGTKND